MMFTVFGIALAVVGMGMGFVGHYADQRLRSAGQWQSSNKISISGAVIALVGVLALLVGTVVLPSMS